MAYQKKTLDFLDYQKMTMTKLGRECVETWGNMEGEISSGCDHISLDACAMFSIRKEKLSLKKSTVHERAHTYTYTLENTFCNCRKKDGLSSAS